MKQKTVLQKAIEMIDTQMNIVENSKKGKDAKYKFGADAAITNLVMTKVTLKGMLDEERKQIEDAHANGIKFMTSNSSIPQDVSKQWFDKTFEQ